MWVDKECCVNAKFEQLADLARELTDLQSIMRNLNWDQETMMPSKGVGFRARQSATLAAICHSKLIDPAFGELLDDLGSRNGLDVWQRASVREARREYDKAVLLPPELVRELAETVPLSYAAWVEARKNSDFGAFSPWLRKVFDLKKRQAECLKLGAPPYDSLLDDWEPGATYAEIRVLFDKLRPQLSELVDRVIGSTRVLKRSRIAGDYPVARQKEFAGRVLTAMGFDWEAGRLDVSPHPFCCGVTPHDVRITTRYSERDFSEALFGVIHEGGHALYEQGLDPETWGTPVCETISLGIHESQSRLWENCVGRSPEFWEYWYPEAQTAFPGQLDDISPAEFLRAINRVKPTFIRVEADELTYGLHVILRTEIEHALLENQFPVEELENVWNEKMEEYLGIRPTNAAQGVLQDVHWSHGLVGYFPTYLLGTLYATQFFETARHQIEGLGDAIRQGQMIGLRDWLSTNIHRKGRLLSAAQLVQEVTGEALQPEFFTDYLSDKYGHLYNL